MKLSVEARGKNYFKAKKFGPHFLSLNCVQTSVGVSFGYRKSLQRIRGMRNVTIDTKLSVEPRAPFNGLKS